MLQIAVTVGSLVNGSMRIVVGSGITSMSDALIGCQPRIELPSKPLPSSNNASSNSLIGMVKCCQMPMKSRNFRSHATALFFFANAIASFGVIERLPPRLLVHPGLQTPREQDPCPERARSGPDS